MTDEQVVIVKKQGTGMVAGIISCVLAILGTFTIGIVFVPLAAITAAIGSIVALKNMSGGGIAVNLLACILVVVGLFTSPALLLAIGMAGSS